MKKWYILSFVLFVILPLLTGGIYYYVQAHKLSSWESCPKPHVDAIKAVIDQHPGRFKSDDRQEADKYVITTNAKSEAINLFRDQLSKLPIKLFSE